MNSLQSCIEHCKDRLYSAKDLSALQRLVNTLPLRCIWTLGALCSANSTNEQTKLGLLFGAAKVNRAGPQTGDAAQTVHKLQQPAEQQWQQQSTSLILKPAEQQWQQQSTSLILKPSQQQQQPGGISDSDEHNTGSRQQSK